MGLHLEWRMLLVTLSCTQKLWQSTERERSDLMTLVEDMRRLASGVGKLFVIAR